MRLFFVLRHRNKVAMMGIKKAHITVSSFLLDFIQLVLGAGEETRTLTT